MVELNLPPLVVPPPPPLLDLIAMETWKLDLKDCVNKQRLMKPTWERGFSLVLGQCSQTIHDRLEASAQWDDINSNTDVIELL